MASFQAITSFAAALGVGMLAIGLWSSDHVAGGATPGAGSAPKAAATPIVGQAAQLLRGGGRAVLERGRDGHFRADARINGRTVDMLVDTGATVVVLPYKTARSLGLMRGSMRFDQPVRTANGVARFAAAELRSVSVGGLRIDNVRALIAPRGRLSDPLLGMSYLGRLNVSFSGDRMVLRR